MEMSKQSYKDIITMPLQRFYNYLSWKSKFDDEKNKMIDERFENLGG